MKFSLIIAIALLVSLSSCFKSRHSDKAGEKMQEFIIDISNYAKAQKPGFIIIPQNGAELAFNYLYQPDGTYAAYLNAIDGFGIEELFYNYGYEPDQERIDMLRELVDSKPVMVSEMVTDPNSVAHAYQLNANEGFLCFVRDANNYDYLNIPDTIVDENSDDILTLAQAKNYLYLISTDAFATKAAFLSAIAATNFDVVLIDLFYGDDLLTATDLQTIRYKNNGGQRLLISYISVGSAENYRYYWEENWKLHHPSWLKREYDGYPDEFWVKFWKDEWREIIFGNDNSYFKKIITAGFDGAYLDNVEAYYYLYFDE